MRSSITRPFHQLSAINNNIVRSIAVDVSAKDSSQSLKPWKELPGPTRWQLLAEIPKYISGAQDNTDTARLIRELRNAYGPIIKFEGILGRPPMVLLFDAENVEQILRSEDVQPIRPGFQTLDYYRRNHNRPINSEYKGFGLLTDYGDSWKKFRSTVNPVLLQPKTIKMYTTMIDDVAQDMIKRMRSLRSDDYKIQSDFEMEMNLWSLESIALVALGRRLGCFNEELPSDSPEKKLIKLVHDIFKIADELDFKPSLWRYFPTRTFRKAMKLFEEQEEVAQYFIDKTIEEINTRQEKKPDSQKGVLEKLLEINKDIAVIMASDMLFAGVDTTSNSITATLYLLATNQEKQDKLRDEINSQTDDNQSKRYLKACLKESMRIRPVVSGNIRLTTKEYNLQGYLIPKGMQISLMHQYMSMLEEHYPRAEEFLPERWFASKDDQLYHRNAHPFANQTFGFGTRSCIGRRIAELEMETFLSRLIQNFKIEWHGPPMGTRSASLNYTTGPYNFTFKDA